MKPPESSTPVRKLVTVISRASFLMGALIVLFAAFQLWGTGLTEERAQQQLAADFEKLTESTSADEPSLEKTRTQIEADERPLDPAPQPSSGVASSIPAELQPAAGEPIGVIKIPGIGVDKVLLQGVGIDELRQGPGHYQDSPLPGQAGNVALAGHRTTYGAPFGELDLLVPGDRIEVETVQGTFQYEVLPQSSIGGRDIGHFIVAPSDTYVIQDYGDNRLTLTACHPKYSAEQRIVVQAELVGSESRFVTFEPNLGSDDQDNPPPAQVETTSNGAEVIPAAEPKQAAEAEAASTVSNNPSALADSLGWHSDELPAVLAWAALFVAIVSLAYGLTRRFRAWPVYLVAAPLAGVTLWSCFSHLDRLIPAY